MSFTYNAAAQLLSVGNTSCGGTFASDTTYAAHGALLTVIHGKRLSPCNPTYVGTTVTNSYNKRLQPITLSAAAPGGTVMSFSYDFELNTADNGNVKKILNNLDANRTQNFTYDHFNRIKSAHSDGGDGKTRKVIEVERKQNGQ